MEDICSKWKTEVSQGWRVRLVSRVEKALGRDIEYCNFKWFSSMDRGNFGERCCQSICSDEQKQLDLHEWIGKGSLSSIAGTGEFPNAAVSGRERCAGAALCSGCAALSWLAGVYLLLFALSQAHWIAAAKYSFALASGIETCAEVFDLCNDCRVFLKVYLHFLKRRETQACTGHGPVMLYQACIWVVT